MCYSFGGSRGPPVVLALLCFALCLTFFFLGQEFLRRPGEGTRMGVLSVCLGALVRPCWLSLRSDCGLVAPCPQASHPAGPDPRRSGFPSCVTRFFGSWRHAASVFVLLFVKILLDIHRQFDRPPRRSLSVFLRSHPIPRVPVTGSMNTARSGARKVNSKKSAHTPSSTNIPSTVQPPPLSCRRF